MNLKINSNYLHIFQNAIFQCLNIGFILLITSTVTVKELGIYGVAKSLFSLLEYSHLGSRFGLDLVLSGRNKSHINYYTRLTASISFWVSLVFLILVTLYYQNTLIFLFLLGSVFYNQFNIYRLSNRARGNTTLFVKQSILINYIPVIFQISGLIMFGFEGLFWAVLFSGFFLYFTKKGDILKFLSINIKIKDFLYLFLNGRALLITNISFIAVTVLDRVFIENFYGPLIAGYYTFIFIFISFLSVIPNSITELFYAKFFDLKRNNTESFRLIKKSSFILFIISAISILIVLFSANFFIGTFFPKYIDIIGEIKFALLYVIPTSLISVFQYYIISFKKNRSIILINVIAFVIFYSIFFLAIFFQPNLNLYDFISIRLIHIWLYFFLTLFILFKTISIYKHE